MSSGESKNIKLLKASVTIQSLFRGWIVRRKLGTKLSNLGVQNDTISRTRKRHKPNDYKPVEELKQDEYTSDQSTIDTSETDSDSDSDYVQGKSDSSESSESSDSSDTSDSSDSSEDEHQ